MIGIVRIVLGRYLLFRDLGPQRLEDADSEVLT